MAVFLSVQGLRSGPWCPFRVTGLIELARPPWRDKVVADRGR
jgi:hypothetical protein